MTRISPTIPLAKLCTMFTDGDWVESKDQSPDGIRLIQTGNIGCGVFKERNDKARYISEDTFSRLNCTEVLAGDCLVSRLPDPVGRSAIIPETSERMITAVDCTIIRTLPDQLLPEFLNYYCQSSSYLRDVESKTTGATRKRISRKNLGAVCVPVPTIPEQKRIVAILDEAFEGIDTAIANAEKNLQNAKELFESHLQSVFAQTDEESKETTIGKEVDLLAGFAFKSKEYTESQQSIRLLRGDNIVQGTLRWDGVKRWPVSNLTDYEGYRLSEGDVVLAMDRPWVNSGLKRAIISDSDLPSLLVQRVARLRIGKNMLSRFLFYLVSSRGFINHILGNQTGIGVPHVSGKQIQSFSFHCPTLKWQSTAVDRLDELYEQSQRLQTIYQQKLANLTELKQSILQKAFSGQLRMRTA